MGIFEICKRCHLLFAHFLSCFCCPARIYVAVALRTRNVGLLCATVGIVGCVWIWRRRSRQSLKEEFIGKETAEALGTIQVIVRNFFQDGSMNDLSYGEFILGISVLMHTVISVPSSGLPCYDLERIQRAARYMSFASAAYGWKMVNALFYKGRPAPHALLGIVDDVGASVKAGFQSVASSSRCSKSPGCSSSSWHTRANGTMSII